MSASPERKQKKPSLYEYTDYRVFLRDFYEFKKQNAPLSFSFRIFSQRAELNSPNYLKMVMDGTRNLSEPMILRFAKALRLGKRQTIFFENLVRFTQAKTQEQKDTYFHKLLEFREYREAVRLRGGQVKCLSHWYYVAIREMVALKGFVESPQTIAAALRPKVSVKEVEEAIRVLLHLKLLERDGYRRLRIAEEHLSTDETVAAQVAYDFHQQMIQRGMEALDQSSEERYLSSVTFALTQKHLKELQEKVFDFLGEVQTWLSALDFKGEEVYQLNFQLFPLTQWTRRKSA